MILLNRKNYPAGNKLLAAASLGEYLNVSKRRGAIRPRWFLVALFAAAAVILPLLVAPSPAQAATKVSTRIASFAAGPATVVKGKSITYSGQAQRASGKSWIKTGTVTVKVYFDPDGSAPKKLLRTLKTNSTGAFKASAISTVTGKWSVQLAAQGAYKGSVTAAKTVKVTAPKPSVTKPADKWNCPAWAPIKGNAPSKIYHMPRQSYYSRTTPEQCFATESAAVKAGYRKSKR